MTRVVEEGLRIAGRYRLVARLGSGGQGEVWRAVDEESLESVALKILSGTFAWGGEPREALQREYQVARELDHPLILKTYPPICDGELAVLPMKLAPGGDLRQLRGAPYVEVLPVLIDLARALEYAHEQGVVHRDLKPANVLFDAMGRVQLADFGVAGRAQPYRQTDEVQAGWSASSASPQQLRGLPPTPADDLYGLGALAFELLTGTPLFFPDFDIRRVLHEAAPAVVPVHRAPRRLLGLVRSMLAKDPGHRPQSMRGVIIGFNAALDEPMTREDRILGATARALSATPVVTPEC